MPRPGHIWLHVIISTKWSWLPGDPRGWRSRHHKTHSSGDYKQPPSPGEHRGLYDLAQQHAQMPVVIPAAYREVVGRTILRQLHSQNCQCLVISVSGMHAHLLVELPQDIKAQRQIMGRCKAHASKSIKSILPGKVWAPAGKFKPIHDQQYQQNAYRYIMAHRDEGAWVWSFRNEKDRGM